MPYKIKLKAQVESPTPTTKQDVHDDPPVNWPRAWWIALLVVLILLAIFIKWF